MRMHVPCRNARSHFDSSDRRLVLLRLPLLRRRARCPVSSSEGPVGFAMPNRKKFAPLGDGQGPFQMALAPIVERIQVLETFVADITPDFAKRTIQRCTELEQKCREHVNQTLLVIHNQKLALVEMVQRATAEAERAARALEDATARHTREAKGMRTELGILKDLLDKQSADLENQVGSVHESMRAHAHAMEILDEKSEALTSQLESMHESVEAHRRAMGTWREECDSERQRCEGMLADLKSTLLQAGALRPAEILLRRAEFNIEQRTLVGKARSLSRDRDELRTHFQRAQSAAGTRSSLEQTWYEPPGARGLPNVQLPAVHDAGPSNLSQQR